MLYRGKLGFEKVDLVMRSRGVSGAGRTLTVCKVGLGWAPQGYITAAFAIVTPAFSSPLDRTVGGAPTGECLGEAAYLRF